MVGIVGWTGLVSLSLSASSLSLSRFVLPFALSRFLSLSLYISLPLSLSRSIFLALFRFLYLSLAAYSGADLAADHHSFEVCGLAPGFPHCLESRVGMLGRRRDVA